MAKSERRVAREAKAKESGDTPKPKRSALTGRKASPEKTEKKETKTTTKSTKDDTKDHKNETKSNKN